MSEGHHPNVDYSPLCTEDDSDKYRSMISCCIWIIILSRFDIAYDTSVMVIFNSRECFPISRLFQRRGLSLKPHTTNIL
jgi:hypothetical protein